MNTAKKLLVAAASVAMAVGFSSRTFAATTTAKYVVIDLSNGTGATSYPVSYLDAVPAGGWTDEYKTTKLVLRRIPAGMFIMGSPTGERGRFSDEVQHEVTIRRPYYVGVFQVTQRQWELVMGTKPSCFSNSSCYRTRPVEEVSYDDIRGSSAGANWPASAAVDETSFLGKLRAKTGLDGFDLPTEAQWEYACRAGTTTALNSGKNLTDTPNDANMDSVGRYWYNGGSDGEDYRYKSSCETDAGTAAVGSYAPNAWGLYDMHGNVLEWCLDWYGSLSSAAAVDPAGPASGSSRVRRGGSWHEDAAIYCRSAIRNNDGPSHRSDDTGFRLCCSVGGIPFDAADPKDDVAKGAVNWAMKTTRTSFDRTLCADDPADCFKIATKDGLLYDIALEDVSCDAVFTIVDAKGAVVADANGREVAGVTSVKWLSLPASGSPYILTVAHGTDAKTDGRYVIAGLCADVGAVKLAKTAVSVKESAAYVDISVNRTGKDGRVRVRYATADGTAKAGEDYKATSGVLEWANGDSKAKKVRIPLIPELVAHFQGNRSFTVRLSAIPEDEMAADEYPAAIVGGDVCTVTITETSKEDVTEAFVYAKQLPKKATVKQDEDVPLSSGTFYGVLAEDGDALTNGLPKVASVTFTASTAVPPALSAKVAIAGKTYPFSAKGFGEMSDGGEVWRTNTLVNVQKSGKVAYTNTLAVYVRDGKTTDEGAWLTAEAWVDLTMNVPDAKGKGMQEGIRYAGNLYRQNDKIQAYLDAAVDFAGYYTVGMTPQNVGDNTRDGGAGRPALPDTESAANAIDGESVDNAVNAVGRDVPVAPNIGSGYLTLTVDSKGGVKVAGMLADGATKPSVSPKACAIIPDEASVNGYAMLVPVHFAKGTACLGGMLRLRAANAETPEGSESRIVVDSSNMFRWYDDSATGCVALYGDDGYISLTPCGGWYDKVINLQRHYLGRALSVETADIEAFPMGELPEGYDYVAGISPNGFALALENDKVVYDKRKIVKTNRLTDFDLSVNPCNVSVKLTRATGLVTGGFSLWGATEDGAKQKEMTGFKTYGVLLLARDSIAPLDERVIAPGFATKKVKTTILDEKGKKKTATWPFSTPFNVVAE